MRPIAILLTIGLLAACGGGDDATDDTADEGVAMSIVPVGDEADAGPVVLPDSFPAEVPIPDAVELDNAEAHVGATSTIFEVTGWFDGDPIRVARDYEEALKDLGYEITSRTESPDNLYFVAENETWYVSAGFFPDPIKNVGASVGITIAPNL